MFTRPVSRLRHARILACAIACSCLASPGLSSETVDLCTRLKSGEPYGVTVQMELGGQVHTPAAEGPKDQQPTKEPVSVAAELSYHEMRVPGSQARSVRFYDKVDVELSIGGETSKPDYRDSRKLVVVESTDAGLRLASAGGALLRSELDIIEVVADSHMLSNLLPEESLQVGDSWRHDERSVQQLVGMGRVDLYEVSSALMEANEHYARCEIAGSVHGVINGADREVELRGVYVFDRKRGRISQLNLAVRENRAIGPATRGLDATQKLRIKLNPLNSSPLLTASRIAQAAEVDVHQQGRLQTRDSQLGFHAVHDLSWFPLGQRVDELALRRVGSEGLIAHANLTKLPAKSVDSGEALAAFRADFVATLGKDVSGLVSDEQWTNEHGCRVMTVVAEGSVGGVPMQWRGYQVAPPVELETLHRLALTVAVEKSQLEQLGQADRDLVNQIELIPAKSRQASRTASRR